MNVRILITDTEKARQPHLC